MYNLEELPLCVNSDKIYYKRKHHKIQIQNTGKVGRVLQKKRSTIKLVEETYLSWYLLSGDRRILVVGEKK